MVELLLKLSEGDFYALNRISNSFGLDRTKTLRLAVTLLAMTLPKTEDEKAAFLLRYRKEFLQSFVNTQKQRVENERLAAQEFENMVK